MALAVPPRCRGGRTAAVRSLQWSTRKSTLSETATYYRSSQAMDHRQPGSCHQGAKPPTMLPPHWWMVLLVCPMVAMLRLRRGWVCLVFSLMVATPRHGLLRLIMSLMVAMVTCVCVDVLALFEHSDVVECYHQKKRINTSAGAYLFGFWDLMHMYHGWCWISNWWCWGSLQQQSL
uniref:Uncharacterized protein n=2 Tax=Triticum urartu TaxID=4572 RepID=A0A8R7PS81_TRIUA